MKGKNRLLGMKEFALQRPGVRNGYGEFVYHQILNNLGQYFLHYDFLSVKINDDYHGIYALEGRFNDDLLEENNIKKQPIFRFNDNRFFNNKRKILGKATNSGLWNDWSLYSARIDCFDMENILQDSILKMNLEIGASKLELFRMGKLKAKAVFDIEKLAIFYAVSDLFGAYHAS